MLNESQTKMLEELKSLRQQVELLESHKNVSFVTPKQYYETSRRILNRLEEIEHEFGIFEDNSINRKFNKIREELDVISKMMRELILCIDKENYDLAVKYEIDNILDETWKHRVGGNDV